MSKNKLSHVAVFLLFLVDVVIAVSNGFDVLFFLAAAATAIVAIFDVIGVIRNARK